jgi:colanic acid/amylovoran biosynthesis glycosyltransferase
MKALRLAIVSPNRNAWSETFIAAHLQHLEGVQLVLTDGYLPRCDVQGKPLHVATVAQRFGARLRRSDPMAPRRLQQQAVVNELRKAQVNLVLAEYGPTGEAMAEVCQQAGCALVVHFHGWDAFGHEVVKTNGAYAKCFSQAAQVIAVSQEMRQQLIALGAPEERVHYNPYGIDAARFAPADRPPPVPTLFAAGRFVDKKAPHLTLAAFREARAQVPSLRLIMAGEGPLHEACRQLCLAWGLQHCVEFPGVLDPHQMAQAMAGATAFVQHSLVPADNDHEGTPLAVLEAMACALPVVATRHGGIMDVVEHGVHGLLSDERDLAGMAANLVAVCTSPEHALEMGRNGRLRVLQRYSLQRVLQGALPL